MTVNNPKVLSDLKLVQTSSEEIRRGEGRSSTDSIKEMEIPIESNVSSGVLDDDSLPKFRSNQSNDTSRYDMSSKKFCVQISRKYLHEHTALGPKLAVMTCPNCLLAIESIVRYSETSLTHIAASCLLPLGLCALPYCTPYFRDAEHYCPMCSVYLGTSFAKGQKALKCCATKTADN